MGSMTARLGLTLLALGLAGPAVHAETERSFVVSSGGDAAVYVSEDGGEQAMMGYFGRLSWETPVPDYTSKSKGYVWNLGLDPDVEFSRAWRDGSGGTGSGQMTMLEAGLKLSVPFSQKRMGLLGISARGGFWFGVRGGVTNLTDRAPQAGFMTTAGPQQERTPTAPDTGNLLLDLSVGEFFLLGDSGLRLEFELASLMTENPDVLSGANYGMRMRAGLGAYF